MERYKMDMTKYTGANYLTAEEVKEATVKMITVLNKGEVKEGKYGDQIEFEVQLAGTNDVKKYTPYCKSVKNMIELHGEDSIKWVGKQFEVDTEKTKNDNEVVVVIIPKP